METLFLEVEGTALCQVVEIASLAVEEIATVFLEVVESVLY